MPPAPLILVMGEMRNLREPMDGGNSCWKAGWAREGARFNLMVLFLIQLNSFIKIFDHDCNKEFPQNCSAFHPMAPSCPAIPLSRILPIIPYVYHNILESSCRSFMTANFSEVHFCFMGILLNISLKLKSIKFKYSFRCDWDAKWLIYL